MWTALKLNILVYCWYSVLHRIVTWRITLTIKCKFQHTTRRFNLLYLFSLIFLLSSVNFWKQELSMMFTYETLFKLFSEPYEKHFTLKDFEVKKKRPLGTMDKQRIKKIFWAKTKIIYQKINWFKMNKSARTIIVLSKNYVKMLCKHISIFT